MSRGLHDRRVSEPFSLNLLGGFGVYRAQQPLALPPSCQQLVALAALKRRTVQFVDLLDTVAVRSTG